MTRPVKYTSNLQKGGALLDKSAMLIESWDFGRSCDDNLAAVANAGAASAVRRSDLAQRILRRRFIDPGRHLIPALKALLVSDRRAFRDACYFETTRSERVLADFAEGPLFERYRAGMRALSVDDGVAWLAEAARSGRAPAWSEAVTARVARGLLAALRDFGVLSGKPGGVTKTIGDPYPSVGGFAYVCWRLQEGGVTAATVELSPVWRRWLLDADQVSGLLAALADHGVILLNRAGSVTRIEWRAATLSEAVHAAA